MRQDAGERCLMERGDLLDILQHGLKTSDEGSLSGSIDVEYGRCVLAIESFPGGHGWIVILEDGEKVHCDLLIGKSPLPSVMTD